LPNSLEVFTSQPEFISTINSKHFASCFIILIKILWDWTKFCFWYLDKGRIQFFSRAPLYSFNNTGVMEFLCQALVSVWVSKDLDWSIIFIWDGKLRNFIKADIQAITLFKAIRTKATTLLSQPILFKCFQTYLFLNLKQSQIYSNYHYPFPVVCVLT
jgi:hypothetical protein